MSNPVPDSASLIMLPSTSSQSTVKHVRCLIHQRTLSSSCYEVLDPRSSSRRAWPTIPPAWPSRATVSKASSWPITPARSMSSTISRSPVCSVVCCQRKQCLQQSVPVSARTPNSSVLHRTVSARRRLYLLQHACRDTYKAYSTGRSSGACGSGRGRVNTSLQGRCEICTQEVKKIAVNNRVLLPSPRKFTRDVSILGPREH